MDMSEFYQNAIGIKKPWFIRETIFDIKKKRVDIYLSYEEGFEFRCSLCNKKSAIYDHNKERTWRHLDTCDFQTFIHAKLPRINCPDHSVLQIEFSWANNFDRFTKQMVDFILIVISSVETIREFKSLVQYVV